MSGAPTDFSHAAYKSGEEDRYSVTIRNAGGRPTNGDAVTITDTLPEGLSPTAVEGANDIGPGFKTFFEKNVAQQHPVALACAMHLHSVVCTDERTVVAGDVIVLNIWVRVSEGLPEGERVVNTVSVSGGGAPTASSSLSTLISSEPARFGLESMSLELTGPDGLPDTQAGAHPYEFTTAGYFNTAVASESLGELIKSVEDPKDIVADLPAGFVGDPQVVEKCSQEDAEAAERLTCPAASQVGVARLDLGGWAGTADGKSFNSEDQIIPIYNVVPQKGVAAQFVFDVESDPVMLFVQANQETNYALRVTSAGIPRIAGLTSFSLTFFGEPQSNHDAYNEVVGASPFAFLQNPVDCAAGPLEGKVIIDTWQHPGSHLPNGSPNLSDPNWKSYSSVMYPSITGCDMLQFEPSITVAPDTLQADEPTGVNVTLHVQQSTNRFPALATPELKDATVTLPAGMSLSPSAADGLGACSNAQIDVQSIEHGSCPDASTLGTVKVQVPLLETPLEGQVFLGSPECDPCNSTDAADGKMVRLFIEAAGSGVRLKKEGRVYLNPSTGQLTAKFLENPQDPFENLEMHFNGGLRAGLATPQTCGPAITTTDLVPWSSPDTPDATPASSFDVSSDGDGGACPAIPPLTPSFSAGTSNPNAGQFSPFTLTFGREDREQDLSDIQVRMPAGLLGTLSGIPLCGEAEANAGTCAAASRIGTMTVAAGPGSHPFYEQGSIYITERYDGAPFGLSIVVPTVAGPFNLGNVVVRAQIDIDPLTAALTVTSTRSRR